MDMPPGGPPPGADGGFDDGFDDMGPPPGGMDGPPMGGPPMGGSGGGPSKPVNIFGIIMGLRKIISVCAILTVIGLEASTAIQDAQLKTLAPIMKATNKFSKRDTLHTGLVLAAKKSSLPKIVCEYYSGFDVPAVKAGRARSVLYHLMNCLALLAMLWLERPASPDVAAGLNCSRLSAPPVGNVGLITFGLLQTWIATSILNHYVGTFTYIAAFVLASAGIMGALFGVIFIGRLKTVSSASGGGMMGGPPMGDMGPMGPPMGGPPPMYDDAF